MYQVTLGVIATIIATAMVMIQMMSDVHLLPYRWWGDVTAAADVTTNPRLKYTDTHPHRHATLSSHTDTPLTFYGDGEHRQSFERERESKRRCSWRSAALAAAKCDRNPPERWAYRMPAEAVESIPNRTRKRASQRVRATNFRQVIWALSEVILYTLFATPPIKW